MAALSAPAIRLIPHAPRRHRDGTERVRRAARRLVHHRSRPPALHRLRADDDRGIGLRDRRCRRRRVAGRLRRGVFRDLRCGHLLHCAADAQAARAGRARLAGRRAAPGHQADMTVDLPLIWAGLIALSVLVYVILDGFDLGIGILFPLVKTEAARDQMMNSVAPVWDGNQTWLVLGGGGLFAVFPLAYAVIMPALYVPIIVMLLA